MKVCLRPGETVMVARGDAVFAVTSVFSMASGEPGLSIRSEQWDTVTRNYRQVEARVDGERCLLHQKPAATTKD